MSENSQAESFAIMDAQMAEQNANTNRERFEAAMKNSDKYPGASLPWKNVSDIANDPEKYGEALSILAKNCAAEMAGEQGIAGNSLSQAVNNLKAKAEALK